MPIARAIVRQLQRPRSGGGVTARSSTCLAAPSASHDLRPRPGASRSPASRSVANRPDPAINLQTRYAQAFGDLLLGQSLSAQQDDLRAPAIADRDRARARPAPQLLSLLRLQFDARPSHDCLPPTAGK